MTHADFTYTNRTGRAPGLTVRALSAALPAVARVWSQVEPYADAWRAHNLVVLAQPGKRWFALGDSLSQGVGASAYDRGWVGQVNTQLDRSGYTVNVINLSATGARVRDVIDGQLPLLASLEPQEGDIVTVMVGSNDLFGGRAARTSLPSTYSEMLNLLLPSTIVCTLTQPTKVTAAANNHVERAAARGAIEMVDLRVTGPSSWRGRLASDVFHPNDAGYAAIAEAFAPHLLARLSEGEPDG